MRYLQRLQRLLVQYRFERNPFYRGPARSDAEAIFVCGCGRSGTTLMRAMLERHPRLWSGPESWLWVIKADPVILSLQFDTDPAYTRTLLAESRTAVEFAERYFGECARKAGKVRWVEKTPRHVHSLAYLMTSFPRARFIHMVRDGRDVACSLRRHPKMRLTRRGNVPMKVNNPISVCIDRWVRDTSAGLAYQGHPRLLTVRYESLVNDPENVLRETCRFIGEDFVPAMLSPQPENRDEIAFKTPNNTASFEPVNTGSIGRWKRDLSEAELATCIARGGPLLATLGYRPE